MAQVAAEISANGGFVSSISTTAVAVPGGAAVWSFITHGTASGQTLPSVVDSKGNSYTQKDAFTWSAHNLQYYLFVADNVTGDPSFTVTVTLSAAALLNVSGVGVTGQRKSGSFDTVGTKVTQENYTSGALGAASVTPSVASDLILLAWVLEATQGAGWNPSLEFNQPGTDHFETESHAYNASTALGNGVYSAPGHGGSNTLNGACGISATQSFTAEFLAIAYGVFSTGGPLWFSVG